MGYGICLPLNTDNIERSKGVWFWINTINKMPKPAQNGIARIDLIYYLQCNAFQNNIEQTYLFTEEKKCV